MAIDIQHTKPSSLSVLPLLPLILIVTGHEFGFDSVVESDMQNPHAGDTPKAEFCQMQAYRFIVEASEMQASLSANVPEEWVFNLLCDRS